MLKRMMYYFWGLFLMAFGTVILLKSELGVAAFDALCYGLSQCVELSVGQCCMILGMIILGINAVIQKKFPSIYSYLTSILVGWFIDFGMRFIGFYIESIWLQCGIFIIGMLINSFGVALYISAELAKGPIDQLMLNISQVLNKEIWIGKTVMETIFLVLAIIVNGPIWIGTLVITFGSGMCINYFFNILNRGVTKGKGKN